MIISFGPPPISFLIEWAISRKKLKAHPLQLYLWHNAMMVTVLLELPATTWTCILLYWRTRWHLRKQSKFKLKCRNFNHADTNTAR